MEVVFKNYIDKLYWLSQQVMIGKDVVSINFIEFSLVRLLFNSLADTKKKINQWKSQHRSQILSLYQNPLSKSKHLQELINPRIDQQQTFKMMSELEGYVTFSQLGNRNK